MSDVRQLDDTGNIVVSSQKKKEVRGDRLDAPVSQDLEKRAIADILGVDADSSKYSDNLQTILEWAKTQSKNPNLEDIRWAVRELDLKLGSAPFGEEPIKWVARYAYLVLEKAKIEREEKEFIKHGLN